ncbi:hypothetical protein BZG36_03195 [Bifiguratus adelaidae]|uniref:Arb2 domain-containing protein n=1 Tax=Bifiguratus adelaidae TaxID=1938954 RepID=A0A261Y1A1_9FUNG|nr:hypothetical protein BZG36_03195 [Bifiguratus adelaidae]
MFRRRPKKKVLLEFPKTLEDFGYYITDKGSVRNKENGEPFDFEHSEDKEFNLQRSDAFTAILNKLVDQKLVQEPYNLKAVQIPTHPETGQVAEWYCTIYMSENAMTTTDKLLVMVPGLNIRVGQWSRRYMVDTNLVKGSALEAINLARKHGHEVMLANPNENFWVNGSGEYMLTKRSKDPQAIPGKCS